jgi:hypothetical protein
MNSTNTLQEYNIKTSINSFLLDPLSVIIKLAILSNKPVGTKLLIQNNVVYFQEPGVFQSLVRMIYNTNKTDLQYMYNPIQIACSSFLTKEGIQKYPRIKDLFICAQNGLKKLIETYKNCSIISLCLNYYYVIITNHVEQKYNDFIFNKDGMSIFYTKEVIDKLNEQWSSDKIKIVLDIISFLNNDTMAINNIKSLETIMENNDVNSEKIFANII